MVQITTCTESQGFLAIICTNDDMEVDPKQTVCKSPGYVAAPLFDRRGLVHRREPW